jgi:hypothetical protein
MGRTRKPAKRYKPRGVNSLAHVMAMQGAANLTRDYRLAWLTDAQEALAAVRTGTAQRPQWATLFDAINLIEEFTRMGICRDDAGLVQAAQDAVAAVLDRQAQTGVRAARAAELATLGDVVTGYADVLGAVTHSQMFDCQARVAARVQRVLRSPAPPAGVRVFEAAAVSPAKARAA